MNTKLLSSRYYVRGKSINENLCEFYILTSLQCENPIIQRQQQQPPSPSLTLLYCCKGKEKIVDSVLFHSLYCFVSQNIKRNRD